MPAPTHRAHPANLDAGTAGRPVPLPWKVPAVHLSVPALRVPALHVPALHLALPRLARRSLPVATVLLTVVYAAAVVVALADPGANTVAGLVVLAGLTARWAVHRRRSTAGALTAATVAVDTVLPEPGAVSVVPGDAGVPAPAPAAPA